MTQHSWCILAALAFVLGCSGEPSNNGAKPQTAAQETPALTAWVVDDPALAKTLRERWATEREQSLTVVEKSSADLLAAKRLETDVVLYPAAILGAMAEQKLIDAASEGTLKSQNFSRGDLFPLVRTQAGKWNQQTYAAPLGAPVFVVYYIRAQLEKHGLSPPATWADYHKAAAQLQANKPATASGEADQPWHGAVEPLAPGFAGHVLLARAAAYARHRSRVSTVFDSATMKPLIDTPPFVRALDELCAAAKLGPAEAKLFSPSDAPALVFAGKAALAIGWPNPSEQSSARAGEAAGVGYAELPGSPEAFNFSDFKWEPRTDQEDPRVTYFGAGGYLASVASTSAHGPAAWQAIDWLCGEAAEELVLTGGHTSPVRERHRKHAARWADRAVDLPAATEYGGVVAQSLARGKSFPALNLPGQERYQAALDRAVHAALSGDQTSTAALAAAAAEWIAITHALGLAPQRAAYERSLGLGR